MCSLPISAAQVVAAHIGVAQVAVVILGDPLVIGVVTVIGVLVYDAAVTGVAIDVGYPVHLVGVFVGHTRVTDQHRVVLVQLADALSRRVIAGIAPVGHRHPWRRAVALLQPP